jgi:hypothetical protein
MICAYITGDLCVSREGKVLKLEEVKNPDLVADKDFCKFKKGDVCEHSRN